MIKAMDANEGTGTRGIYLTPVNVEFCRTKQKKLAVIHEDYYFVHQSCTKDRHYWVCSQRSCKVRLCSQGQWAFSRHNYRFEHQHPPNAPKVIARLVRDQLRDQFSRRPDGSSRHVYDRYYQSAIEQGNRPKNTHY